MNAVRPSHDAEPIAALASGSGAAAVAVIRLSGEGTLQLLASCLSSPLPEERTFKLVKIVQDGDVLDAALCVAFKGPRSFTGEDSAELHCHGGPYVVRRVLELLYAIGFRAAEPGEFTRRAFLRGKLDLTAAEGIRELVEAESHQQWVAARHLASGRLKDAIETLRKTLIGALAHLEAQIDFPDEGDTSHVTLAAHVTPRVRDVQQQIERLTASYDSGRVASRGLMVTLFGEPNAGKSTLMNELLGRERAIVTPVAGTTRDYLEERCLVDGRLIRLFDMAGIRDDPDPVEAIGVEAARRLAAEADLVVFLAPADAGADAPAKIAGWEAELKPRDSLKLLTKSDLGTPAWAKGWAALSCKSGAGLGELRKTLAQRVDRHMGGVGKEEAFVTSARHVAALGHAKQSLDAFFAATQRGEYVELLAFELQQAVRALRTIVGDVGTEDVLDEIFAQFCVGK